MGGAQKLAVFVGRWPDFEDPYLDLERLAGQRMIAVERQFAVLDTGHIKNSNLTGFVLHGNLSPEMTERRWDIVDIIRVGKTGIPGSESLLRGEEDIHRIALFFAGDRRIHASNQLDLTSEDIAYW